MTHALHVDGDLLILLPADHAMRVKVDIIRTKRDRQVAYLVPSGQHLHLEQHRAIYVHGDLVVLVPHHHALSVKADIIRTKRDRQVAYLVPSGQHLHMEQHRASLYHHQNQLHPPIL